MSNIRKGLKKVEVGLRWDPSPLGSSPHDLDIVAATYTSDDPYGSPAYLVHFDSRSPDGTITLSRDSKTGQGFGYDEVMVLELERLAERYVRVVVGVAIQQPPEGRAFGDIVNASVRIREGYTDLVEHDFAEVAGSTASVVAEFTRDQPGGPWAFRELLHGFDTDLASFTSAMGGVR
ncbi:TerD family protein [Streptomyces spectabilis]|uniref:Tellurium resistance protein TerD n=1 Tax=Streptomyces spectabilis TaxID=68270 RepID=A0A5P2XFT1_STRST|nr:TerD family protein [Streptomyces spectabilis]MBB5104848.1 tellurium resistance protein TerD [Streptomyces spectabilis]MCI3905584.1 TerD family protein [Streptomyces spectabilis]QEV62554.1 TerD-family protein [Streptomyces spectabilis]GGV07895.1 TerD-family protein [Streptomyces spectabilis]